MSTTTSQFATWTPVASRPRCCGKDQSLFWNDLPTAPITAAEAWAGHERGELTLACRHRPDSVILVVKTTAAWKQLA